MVLVQQPQPEETVYPHWQGRHTRLWILNPEGLQSDCVASAHTQRFLSLSASSGETLQSLVQIQCQPLHSTVWVLTNRLNTHIRSRETLPTHTHSHPPVWVIQNYIQHLCGVKASVLCCWVIVFWQLIAQQTKKTNSMQSCWKTKSVSNRRGVITLGSD